jgi:diamine N-acetyltransferase
VSVVSVIRRAQFDEFEALVLDDHGRAALLAPSLSEVEEALQGCPDGRQEAQRRRTTTWGVKPDGRALYRAVYAEETPVGFVMIGDEVGTPDYIPHYLWKLLIDERYQRQGFGTATLDLIDDEVLLRLNLH